MIETESTKSYYDLSKIDKLKARAILLKSRNPLEIMKNELNVISNYLENYNLSDDLKEFLKSEKKMVEGDIEFYSKFKERRKV